MNPEASGISATPAIPLFPGLEWSDGDLGLILGTGLRVECQRAALREMLLPSPGLRVKPRQAFATLSYITGEMK